jgi:hypothetical protein
MDVSIRVQGHLDPSWQQRLEGLQMVQESDGTLRLAGHLLDQPALYGVLAKLNHLSLTLLSLECSDGAEYQRGQQVAAPFQTSESDFPGRRAR